jgi:hypothetical protein
MTLAWVTESGRHILICRECHSSHVGHRPWWRFWK